MTEVQKKFLEFCKREQPNPFIPTEPQQKAIFGNINIVAAGAGSGKTAVLSHRFLYLVMTGIHADEILTMTFTKDATANMKKKIYQLLKRAVDEGLISAAELEKFSASTISTTDGFCSEIAKSACSTYGVSSKFQIESDDELTTACEQISDDVLDRFQDAEGMKLLLDVWSISNIKEFLLDIARKFLAISRPLDFTEYKKQILDRFGQYTEQGLQANIDAFINDAKSLPKPAATTLENIAKAETYLKDPCIENLLKIMKLKKLGPAEIKEEIICLTDYAKCYSTVHPQSLALLDFILILCSEFQNAVFKHKRETGCVTYRDVLIMALDTLASNDEIRSYYQNKFKSIMVDEFQDNNEDNKTLVYLVAGNDKSHVFMVGDEKQSIYRFRNADVSVFKRMSEDFTPANVVQLQQNYRSEKSLIEIINQIFEKVFDGSSEDYEATYTPLVSDNDHVKPKVVFYYNNDEENKGTKTAEAENIASVIQQILGDEKDKYQVPCKDGLRNPQPSDIAILLKVGTHQIFYEKALRKRSIPFEAIENKSLTLDAVANDFYNILQLAVWGENDQLAALAYKSSPLGNNKSDDELKSQIRAVRDKLGVATIAQVLFYIWNDLGYRFFILRNKKNHQYGEHFDFLFTLATDYDRQGKTVVDFLDYLRPMLGDECSIKEVEIQRETESGVKIMTIHKSKGLEFPIVIIPDMQSGSRSSGGFKPNIRDEKSFISFPYAYDNGSKGNPTLFNPYIDKDDESRKDFAETKRVLYVAATRAQYHLIMSGVVKKSKDGEYGNTMVGCLLKAMDFEGERNPNVECIPYDTNIVSDEEDGTGISEYSDDWYEDTYDFKYRKLTSAITSLDIDKETKFNNPLPLFESDSLIDSWTDFGTHVHALLERTLCNMETETFYGSYEDNPNRDIIQKCALQMRNNFINSDFYKSLSSYEKYTERGFFYFDSESGDVMEGVVDLLCVGKDDVIIVDYKTDKFKDAAVHKGQLVTYIRAMEERYNRPAKAYLFYVRSAEVEQI